MAIEERARAYTLLALAYREAQHARMFIFRDQLAVKAVLPTLLVERRSASMVVARIIKAKFVLKDSGDATTVLQASTPRLPIERGLAGPGTLADTLVKRWDDHLPLNRLEKVYARDGIELNRSTICGWHTQLTPLFKPLIDAMRFDAFEQPYICTDATGVLVQAKEKCRTGPTQEGGGGREARDRRALRHGVSPLIEDIRRSQPPRHEWAGFDVELADLLFWQRPTVYVTPALPSSRVSPEDGRPLQPRAHRCPAPAFL